MSGRPSTDDAQKSSAVPTVPPNGWTVIWCDEMAFKVSGLARRQKFEDENGGNGGNRRFLISNVMESGSWYLLNIHVRT